MRRNPIHFHVSLLCVGVEVGAVANAREGSIQEHYRLQGYQITGRILYPGYTTCIPHCLVLWPK